MELLETGIQVGIVSKRLSFRDIFTSRELLFLCLIILVMVCREKLTRRVGWNMLTTVGWGNTIKLQQKGEIMKGNPAILFLALATLLFVWSCNDESCKNGPADGDTPETDSPVGSGWSTAIEGGRYWIKDEMGRIVLLRGVGMGGGSKMPPFLPVSATDDHAFIQLQSWGINAVRLAIPWEAIEPEPGQYDQEYLEKVEKIVDMAHEHGLVIVLDMHQDFYSRCMGGDGAPRWAIPPELVEEDDDCMYKDPIKTTNMNNAWIAWSHFWTDSWRPDDQSLQDHFLQTWLQVVARFHDHPGVIGYDLHNEPYQLSDRAGFEEFAEMETDFLMPLYQKLATHIREKDPDALFFIEPTIRIFSSPDDVFHSDTKLTALEAGGTVLAPHFYDIDQLILMCLAVYDRLSTRVDSTLNAFDQAGRERIKVPVVIGEYCANPCKTGAAADLMHQLAVQESLAMGSFYWNYWRTGETWMMTGPGQGGEDMSMVTPAIFATEQYPEGTPRCSVEQFVRPYPMRVAGLLQGFRYDLSFADYKGLAHDWLGDDTAHPFTNTRKFTLTFLENGVKANTLVFIPREMAYGNDLDVEVSDGSWAWSTTDPNVLVWTTDPKVDPHILTVSPAGEPEGTPLPLCDPVTH